jgi:transposase-like protein
LVAAGKTVAEGARLLEVSDQSIYRWRRQELIDRGELPGSSSPTRLARLIFASNASASALRSNVSL